MSFFYVSSIIGKCHSFIVFYIRNKVLCLFNKIILKTFSIVGAQLCLGYKKQIKPTPLLSFSYRRCNSPILGQSYGLDFTLYLCVRVEERRHILVSPTFSLAKGLDVLSQLETTETGSGNFQPKTQSTCFSVTYMYF
jgi:hypothetical protein